MARELRQPLRLNLPAQAGLDNLGVFAQLASELAKFSHGRGARGVRGLARKQVWLAHLRARQPLTELLHTPADVRLAIALWLEGGEFAQLAPLTPTTLRSLQQRWPAPSALLLAQWLRLYFDQYDLLPAWRELGTWLHRLLAQTARLSPLLPAVYRERYDWLLHPHGPAHAADAARAQGMDLRELKLPENGRFFHLTMQAYYLAPLGKLAVGEATPLLAMVARDSVKTLPLDGGLLGHAVARLLMDKILATRQPPPPTWRDAILAILEDPRVPRASKRFQTWWARLPPHYTQAMRSWLSQVDLRLFLNIVEDVAHGLNKQELLRMFPARKRFLEGLQQQGLILESRLLLSRQAERFVRAQFAPEALPEFASLANTDISIIYIRLATLDGNEAHLLEGTHSFQLRLYPSLAQVANYENTLFSLNELRNLTPASTIRHAARWQPIALEALRRLGVAVAPE